MLTFSLMGYESVNLPLQTDKKEYRVSLKPKTIQMKEVTVKAPKIRTKEIPSYIMYPDSLMLRTRP